MRLALPSKHLKYWNLPMLRQRLTPTILGMRPPGFSVILPPPKKETQWISLDNQALFSQHFGGFFPSWEMQTSVVQKGSTVRSCLVLISPISLPRLPQFERKTSSSLSSSSGLMCGSTAKLHRPLLPDGKCALLKQLGGSPASQEVTAPGPVPSKSHKRSSWIQPRRNSRCQQPRGWITPQQARFTSSLSSHFDPHLLSIISLRWTQIIEMTVAQMSGLRPRSGTLIYDSCPHITTENATLLGTRSDTQQQKLIFNQWNH